MTKIIAFSGRKGSGKNTCANYIFGKILTSITLPGGDPIVSYFKISRKGKLIIPAMVEPHAVYNEELDQFVETNDRRSEGIFDPLSKDPTVVGVLFHNVWQYVKIYHFADALKETIAIGLLGLTREQVYIDKESPTHLKWEDFPLPRSLASLLTQNNTSKKAVYDFLKKSGPMTSREVLQMIGTDIFRRFYSPVWVNACLNSIQADKPEMAIIADLRFEDEALAVQKAGDMVIRLTRGMESTDVHESETALDHWNGFDAILDNQSCSQHETFEKLTQIL